MFKFYGDLPGSFSVNDTKGNSYKYPFIDVVIARDFGDDGVASLSVLDRVHPASLLEDRTRTYFAGVLVWAPR